jgi:ATP-binding cassette, subfamily B, bacterial
MRDRWRAVGWALRTTVRAEGWRVAVIGACALTLALQAPATALALAVLTDGAVDGDHRAVVLAGTALAVLTAVMFSVYGIRVPLETTVVERTTHQVEREVMQLVAAVPTLELHERPDVADRLEVLRTHSHAVAGTTSALLDDVAFVVGAGFALALLARVELLLLALPLCGVPLLLATAAGQRLTSRALDATAEQWRRVGGLFDAAADPGWAKDVRMLGLLDEVLARHERQGAAASSVEFRAGLRAAALSVAGWLVFVSGWGMAVVLVTRRAAQGEATPGSVVLVVVVAALVQGYVAGTARIVGDLGRQLSVATRYAWLLGYARDHAPPGRVEPPEVLRQGITLEGVGFAYPESGAPALRNVNLTFPAGCTVGLLGENGAGKTTLVKLLLGLYTPTSGRIVVDGTGLAGIDPARWRRRTAAVFQDHAHLEFVLRESVGLGEQTRVTDAAAVQRVLDRSTTCPLPGLEQQLGREWDGGVDLSGGQWQQVAVARGSMRSLPLLRVLDEPSGALDAQAEQDVLEVYAGAGREAGEAGTVTVVVSHRFAAVRDVDLIVVLREGRVAECGTHADLLRRGGVYATLLRLQADAYR